MTRSDPFETLDVYAGLAAEDALPVGREMLAACRWAIGALASRVRAAFAPRSTA